jgi:hypothetical protein
MMMFVLYKSNTTGATRGAGNASHSGAHEFTLGFSWFRVAQSLVFSIVFCRSLFVLFFFWQSFHHVVCYTYFKISFSNQKFRVHIHKNPGRPYTPIILKTI